MIVMEEPPNINTDPSPPPDSRRTFGDMIKEYRTNVLHVGQQECADRVEKDLGITFTRNGWAKIENSPFRQVRHERIQKAAAGLGLSFETVLEWARALERSEKPSVASAISSRITEARMGAGLGIGIVASRVGVTPELYGRWEDGRSIPDAVQLYHLSAVFGVPIASLYGEETARPQKSMSDELQEIKDDMDDIREILRAMRDKED